MEVYSDIDGGTWMTSMKVFHLKKFTEIFLK